MTTPSEHGSDNGVELNRRLGQQVWSHTVLSLGAYLTLVVIPQTNPLSEYRHVFLQDMFTLYP